MQFQPKYAELQDKSWLEQKYHQEELSSTAISKIVGCHKDSVIVALKRHGIPIRDIKAARCLVPLQSFKYDILNDKEWLYQKYIVEQLSTESITELIGAKTCNTVRQALLRYDIPVRTVSDGLTIGREDDGFHLDEYTQQLIEGGLLGDAYMGSYNPSSDYSYPSFKRKNKFYDHVLYVISELGMASDRIRKEEQTLNNKKYQAFSSRTLTHKSLLPVFREWYPAWNNYKKVVPKDLVLTPLIVLHWFLDDGTSSWRNRKYPKAWQQ